ncbi:MAG: hypothetical protein PWQ93_1721 [Clostridiales bacterium]|nr:hypothetical protein [Clostridiales bacterium]
MLGCPPDIPPYRAQLPCSVGGDALGCLQHVVRGYISRDRGINAMFTTNSSIDGKEVSLAGIDLKLYCVIQYLLNRG